LYIKLSDKVKKKILKIFKVFLLAEIFFAGGAIFWPKTHY